MTTLTLDQAVIESMRSPKFQAWGKPTKGVEKSSLSLAENHYKTSSLQ